MALKNDNFVIASSQLTIGLLLSFKLVTFLYFQLVFIFDAMAEIKTMK